MVEGGLGQVFLHTPTIKSLISFFQTDLTNFCIDRTDGIYADPTNCAAFIQCSDYYTYHQECAPGSVFNPSLGVCDNHDLVPECDHVAGD